ncbi:MAG TPA: hypothetical protein VIT67_07065 [Povalibacter sp.]
MASPHRSVCWVVAAAAWLVHLAATAAVPGAAISEPLEAIWRVQTFPFEYRSLDTYYNCDSLEQKMRAILEAVGAHRSVVVQTNCEGGLAKRISARIAIATPVPASEENLRAATAFTTRDELVARIHRIALPTSADVPRFTAQWQTLSLARIRDATITLSDCDLLRGMSEQVFPRIAVRVTKEKFVCNNFASRVRPNIKVEALVPLAALTPAAQTSAY